MNKIKVIIKRPDEAYGHVTWISNTLPNLQKTVGGDIETVSCGENAVIICNEDGKNMGLPKNFRFGSFDVIVGTVIVCGVKDEDFADVPFGMSTWRHLLNTWGNKVNTCGSCVVDSDMELCEDCTEVDMNGGD